VGGVSARTTLRQARPARARKRRVSASCAQGSPTATSTLSSSWLAVAVLAWRCSQRLLAERKRRGHDT
jgi:hypothetical protein